MSAIAAETGIRVRTAEERISVRPEELQKASDLYGKGSITSPRVTDPRRAVLLSSTRKLQTSAQLMQVKKQRDDLSRRLEKLDDQRRLELFRELQDTSAKLKQIREKLQSVGDEASVHCDGSIATAIIRKAKKGQERIVASEDTELQPGDAVEVTLRYQDGPDAPPRRPSNSNIPLAIAQGDATADNSLRVGGTLQQAFPREIGLTLEAWRRCTARASGA
jgi:polysaccharide export outer membrane protein